MYNDEIDIEALKENREFLANLVLLEEEMREQKSLQKGYQLLDALLLIASDEEKINELFTFIIKEAFDRLAERLSQQKGFEMLSDEDLFTVRAIYEHAIERYSEHDMKGAKEFFLILNAMVDDARLKDAMMVHLLSVMQGLDFDTFIEEVADTSRYDEHDRLAYFLLFFKIDTEKFLAEHIALADKAKEEMKISIKHKKPKE